LLLLLGLLSLLSQGCLSLSLLLLLAVLLSLSLNFLSLTLFVSLLLSPIRFFQEILFDLFPLIHTANSVIVRRNLSFLLSSPKLELSRIPKTSSRFSEAFLLVFEPGFDPDIRQARH
jgi:hypothetical protein